MNEIRFSNNYPKLHNQTTCKLIHVTQIKVPDGVHEDLIKYDCTLSDGSQYEIKDGDYLLLVFLGDKGIPFTTIRKLNYENCKKYCSAPYVGMDEFKIIIEA